MRLRDGTILLVIIILIINNNNYSYAAEQRTVWYTMDENSETIHNDVATSTPFYSNDRVSFPSTIGSNGIYQLNFHNSVESLSFVSVWYGGLYLDNYLESNKDLGSIDSEILYVLAPGENLSMSFQIEYCDNVKKIRPFDLLAVNETIGTISLETKVIEPGKTCDTDKSFLSNDWINRYKKIGFSILLIIPILFLVIKQRSLDLIKSRK